jgi:uncharacterized membrane protein YphA (DoxX/SURF4 family)
MSIYVEIHIRCPLEKLWQSTQEPHLHQRWDLRFSNIEYLPRPDDTQPQRFLYATRLGLGLRIEGGGETVANRIGDQGQRTSSLKFWSDDPKSLICDGSGYWQYIPTDDGLRFITGYTYQVRFGALGRIFDTLIFRPLMGWATAWSFDRLKLWLEKSVDPAVSLQRSLIHGVARLVIAFVWLYQGLVPKLIFRHSDELAMLADATVPLELAQMALSFVGWAEVGLGLVLILAWRTRWLFLFNIVLMALATVGVVLNSPHFLVAAFNPATLNLLVAALSLIGYLSSNDLPSARNCLRTKPGVNS